MSTSLNNTTKEIDLPEVLHEGKVRDVYDIGHNKLLLHTSDRVSAFDKIWCDVKSKGAILNETSAWWFKQTSHIIPNHLVHYSRNNAIVRKCRVFPIEVVVRGYITGNTQTSLWMNYKSLPDGEKLYCGILFPDGLRKNQKLDKPVITPTTKSETHDEPMSPAAIIENGILSEREWEYIQSKAIALFEYGQRMAHSAGLILVDTKYEFGRDEETNEIILCDELHTCDSSRYWKESTYWSRFEAGEEPHRFDKDVLRNYINSIGDPYSLDPKDVSVPDDVIDRIKAMYHQFYIKLTGKVVENFECVNPQKKDLILKDIQEDINIYFKYYHKERVYIFSADGQDGKGSGDDWHYLKIKNALEDYKVYHEKVNIDPYETTSKLLESIKEIENSKKVFGWKVVYVVTESCANHLSLLVSCNTKQSPVINCPSFKNLSQSSAYVLSVLRQPPTSRMLTVLNPSSCAEAVQGLLSN